VEADFTAVSVAAISEVVTSAVVATLEGLAIAVSMAPEWPETLADVMAIGTTAGMEITTTGIVAAGMATVPASISATPITTTITIMTMIITAATGGMDADTAVTGINSR